MLLLLNSDFRTQMHREAFLSLVRDAGVPDQMIELPVISRHKTDLFDRLRTMTSIGKGLVVVGSMVRETLAMSVAGIEKLRQEFKPLTDLPFILLARTSEWMRYPQIDQSPFGGQLEYFHTHLANSSLLVLPQNVRYGETVLSAVRKHYAPERAPSSRDRDITVEMFVDDGRQTGRLTRLPEGFYPEAQKPPRKPT